MDFQTIQALTADDMARVDQKILAQLNSNVALINQLGFYIVSSGGKRLRPMLAILSAKALNYQGDGHITAAAFIEFIHTATLLHCLLYTSPSPRDKRQSRMPSSA